MRCERDGPDAYLSFFDVERDRSEDAWRLEATPDYLYSPSTPRLIRKTLPNVRFIFLLREPVSRLRSFYRFGQQRNDIPRTMSFDRYIEVQRDNFGVALPNGCHHPAFYALPHGRYSLYLKVFLEAFGRSAIYIAFYEELRRNPLSFIGSICQWIGIDERYFQHYSFDIKNQSVKVRNPRVHRLVFETDRKVRLLARSWPRLGSALVHIGRRANVVYRRMNVTKGEEIMMSSSTKDFVSSYYKEEPARLREMLGMEVPWP
jgi:hypothetical protein